MFKITLMAAFNLVESQLGGLLTTAEVHAYDSELHRLFDSGKIKPAYAMLIDVRECSIQPQPVIEALIDHVVRMPKARSICVVTGNSVVRLQARRVLRNSVIELIEDRDEALQWLLSPTRSGPKAA